MLSLEDSFKESLFFLLSILLNRLLGDAVGEDSGTSVNALSELSGGSVNNALLDGSISKRLVLISNLLTTTNDSLGRRENVNLRRS